MGPVSPVRSSLFARWDLFPYALHDILFSHSQITWRGRKADHSLSILYL